MDSSNADFTKLVPEAELVANNSGLTVFCPKRLNTPRYLPFEQKGLCKMCHSNELEVSYMIDDSGITLSTNRNKRPRFIAFDKKGEFSVDGAVVAKFRRKNFTIPLKKKEVIHHPLMSNDHKRFKVEDIPLPDEIIERQPSPPSATSIDVPVEKEA